jgi:hypothetical protein
MLWMQIFYIPKMIYLKARIIFWSVQIIDDTKKFNFGSLVYIFCILYLFETMLLHVTLIIFSNLYIIVIVLMLDRSLQ